MSEMHTDDTKCPQSESNGGLEWKRYAWVSTGKETLIQLSYHSKMIEPWSATEA